MQIILKIDFQERGVLHILNALVEHNCELLRMNPQWPLLYDACVIYRRESQETFVDYAQILAQGGDDCDSLACARAAELRVRGFAALRPHEPGFSLAQRFKPASIEADVMLTTRTKPHQRGLFHCITRYWIGQQEFRDDPSARLGMLQSRVDPNIAQQCHFNKLNDIHRRTV